MIIGVSSSMAFQSTLSMRRATHQVGARHVAVLHFNPRSP